MPLFSDARLAQVVDLIYRAALDEAVWPQVLEQLSEASGGAAVLDVIDLDRGDTVFMAEHGLDPDFGAAFVAHYSSVNPYPKRALALMAPGQVALASEVIAVDEARHTEFWNDFLQPMGSSLHHLGVKLLQTPDRVAVLGLHPMAARFDDGADDYAKGLSPLVPHLVRAITMNHAFAAYRSRTTGIGLFDALRVPVIVLDASGRVLEANSHAEQKLSDATVLRSMPDRSLEAVVKADDDALQTAIRRLVLAPTADGSLEPMRLRSADGRASLVCWSVPIAVGNTTLGDPFTPLGLINALSTQPAVALILTPAADRSSVTPDQLDALFGLTDREADVALALMRGMTLQDCAAAIGLSRNTVRNHLAKVFEKTGTNRQAELVAKLVWATRII